ncbi:MAG TPA: hypothetical protein VGN26_23255 [Armatimonadota bacterium]|jgi:hypothetical protein
MLRRDKSELGAGIAAVSALLVCAFPLGLPFLVSLGLAVLVYAGVVNLLAAPQGPGKIQGPSLSDLVTSISSLEASVRRASVKEKIDAICTQAGRMGQYFSDNEEDFRMYRPAVIDSLRAVQEVVSQYGRLSRHDEDSNQEVLLKLEGYLQQSCDFLEELHSRLLAKDRAEMTDLIETMGREQEAIRQTYQYLGGGNP